VKLHPVAKPLRQSMPPPSTRIWTDKNMTVLGWKVEARPALSKAFRAICPVPKPARERTMRIFLGRTDVGGSDPNSPSRRSAGVVEFER